MSASSAGGPASSIIDTSDLDGGVPAGERPGPLDARPVRHPWRWVGVGAVVVVLAMMVNSLLTNPRWEIDYALAVMNYRPVLEGLWKGTIAVTVGAMILGVTLGVLLAVMRLSENPVLRWVAAAYTWFFRSVPRIVLLAVLGTGLGYLYPRLDIGFPFGQQIASMLGLGWDFTFFTLDVNQFSSTLAMGIIGLGLSEAAYFAEIARAGILSVDPGQSEAAKALGMSPRTTMWRIVLPQAMRVMVPPTGNEVIAMVKDTSLLTAVPIVTELFFQTQVVANRTFKIMPSYVAAVGWYIVICSVLMFGQMYLERRFGQGFGAEKKTKREQTAERLMKVTDQH